MSKFHISPEDKELLKKAMEHVTPLKKSNKIQTVNNKNNNQIKNHLKIPQVKSQLDELPIIRQDFINDDIDKIGAQSVISYASNAITRGIFRQLKRGKIPINATLDLHGENISSTINKLNNLFHRLDTSAPQLILLIHGKGLNNPQGPIIKNFLNNTLRSTPGVIAFHSATSAHGGSGALYLLYKAPK